ncbi:hypothetical protein ABZT48_10185 [Streptomyces avermitilis]|uniref:hypothetical protein n=1 Tax=Streptomyces avermitilis TaxID=33903 RepID=UPI0033B041C8
MYLAYRPELDDVAELLDEDTPTVWLGGCHTECGRAELATGDLPAAARSTARAIAVLPRYSRMHANTSLSRIDAGWAPS